MNNDLISRNDLEKFKILPFDKASYDDTEINAAYQNGWNDAIDRIIDNAPTVDTYTIEDIKEVQEKSLILGAKLAQRPQWDIRHTELLKYFVKCKKCGEEIMTSHKNYCPNCGAEMRKGGAE